jgi:hypothetical protein
LLKLLHTSWTLRKRDEAAIRESLRVLAEFSFHNYEHPLDVLDARPEVPRVVVDYRDLVAEPAGTVRSIYKEFGLELTPDFDARLSGEQGRPYVSTHSYSLEEYGLEAGEIRRRLAPLFERFRWDEEVPADVSS